MEVAERFGASALHPPRTKENELEQVVAQRDNAPLMDDVVLLPFDLVVGVARVLAQHELLYHGVGESASDVDERGGKDQSRSAIALRIVEVCE
jgi:hypothetical protein